MILTAKNRPAIPEARPGFRSLMGSFALVIGVVLPACMAQSVVVAGESAIPPPGETAMVTIQVQDDRGLPIGGAEASADDLLLVSDEAGQVQVRWEGDSISVSVRAEGFFPAAVAVDEYHEEPLELALRPAVLRGAVLAPGNFGLPAASVSLGDTVTTTDESGRFEISRASAGTITVERPGWERTEVYWPGTPLVTSVEVQPLVIKALHIGHWVYTDQELWRDLLKVAEETVVNAFVIDVKGESGRVLYDSKVPLARRVGAVEPLVDLDRVIVEMDRRDLYKIARLVTFQDPIAARAEVDMAVHDTRTGGPYNKGGQYFLDPTDGRARAYALDLAQEVCKAGFDEIQFDYVRYPDGFPDSARFDHGSSAEVRTEAITGFLREAAELLHPLGCLVAADIFGFITTVQGDGGIGQEFVALSQTLDVISPMLYPSHYSRGWFGFDVPNNHPGEVVGHALDDAIERRQGSAIIRPWLQDFGYNPAQVRAEIRAAEARGGGLGWMLWNAVSRFQVDALEAAPQPASGSGAATGAPADPGS